MAEIKVTTRVDLETKQAEKQIKDFNRSMSTIAGQKTVFIKAKIEGANDIQKRLEDAIEGIRGIKFNNKGVMTQVLGIDDARKALSQLENDFKKATGRTRTSIEGKIGRVNEYIGAYNEAIDYRTNQILSGRAVSNQRQLGKYYNEGRSERIRQIDSNLSIAKESGDYRQQIGLLKEKAELLEKIDKTNRAKTDSPDLIKTRKELEAVREKYELEKAAARERKAQEDDDKQADKRFRKEAMAKLRESDKQATKAAKDAEREQAEIEKRKTKLVQEETRKRIEARRKETQANKESGRWQTRRQADAESNRIIAGGSSNTTLANMRAFYTEQSRAANKMQKDAERTVASQERVNRAFRHQSQLLSGLTRLAMRYFSIFTVINVGRKMIETTGYFEQQRVALEGIFHSAEKARDAIEQIKQMALKSPFETKELIGGAKQLSAYGIDKDELLQTTKMIGDLSAGLGVSMDRLILAYGQVKSATVLRGQELRQFTEAGVPIVEKLAEKLSEAEGKAVGTKDVFEYISKRKVPFEMVASVLKDMTSEGGKFFNMQEELTDTLYGQVQKLKDVWTLALNDIGSGFGKTLRSMIEGVQVLIKHFRTVVGIIGGAALGAAFGRWREKLIEITSQTKEVQKAQARVNVLVKTGAREEEIAAAKTALHATKMSSLAAAAKSMIASLAVSTGIMALFTVIGAIAGKIWEASEKAKEFRRAIADVDHSIDKDAFAKKDGFDALVEKLKMAKAGTKEYEDAVSAIKSNYSEFINPKYIDFLLQEGKAVAANADEWDRLASNIKKAIDAQANSQRHKEKADLYSQRMTENFEKSDTLIEIAGLSAVNETAVRRGKYDSMNIAQRNELEDLQLKAEGAIVSASETFFANAGRSEAEFKKALEEQLRQYQIPKEQTKYILNQSSALFKALQEDATLWRRRIAELDAGAFVTLDERMAKKFESAYQTGQETPEKDYKKWGDVKSGEFNPFYQRNNTLNNTLDVFTTKSGDKLKNFFDGFVYFVDESGHQIKKSIENVVKGGEEGIEKYRNALKTVNDEIGKLRDNPNDWDSLLKLNNALYDLGTTLKDTDIVGELNRIKFGLQKNVPAASDDLSVQINQYIDELIRKEIPSVLSKEEFDKKAAKFNKYRITDNEEYYKNVTELYKLQKQLKKDIDDLKKGIGAGKASEVKDKEEELRLINLLINPRGYWAPSEEKGPKPRKGRTPAPPREQVPPELVELFDKLKNAYETYKGAAQQFGTGFGVDFMKGDEHMKDMFAEFFNGLQGKEFQELKTKKIGKHSNKTLYDVLEDKFIAEGLEDGIINFEKAALAVADELMHYYEGNTELRKNFKNYAESIKKWAYSISRDNLAARAEELKRTLSDITNTFQRTGQNIESFNKLVEKGTYRALGKELGVSLNDLLTPKSKRTETLARDLAETYNKEGQKQASTVKGARFTDIDLGDLSTVEGIEKAIKLTEELVRMNDRNFAALEMGSISAEAVKSALNELLSARRAELEELSGDSFTGNGLADAIYNAIVKADSEAIKARKISTVSMAELGRIDHGALLEMQKANEEQVAKILEEFMSKYFLNKDLGDLSKIGIDIYSLEDTWAKMMEDMEKRLEEFGEAGKGIIDEVRKKGEELRKNLRELATKTEPFKATIDELNKFKNAKQYAQERYDYMQDMREHSLSGLSSLEAKIGLSDEELSRMNYLRSKGDLTQEEQDEMGGILSKYHLTQEQIDEYTRLTAVLADANAELEKMGENGAALAKQEQLAAINNMIAAYETIEKEVNTYAESFRATMEAIKGVVDFTEKFVDIMSDGEPPTWLSDTSAFLGDLIDGFNAVITTVIAFGTAYKAVMAAVAAASAGNPALLIIMGIAAAVAILMAAIQAHDRSIEHSIENIKDRMEELEHQMKILDAQAERMAGFDNFNARLETTAAKLQQSSMNARMAELELSKKNADIDKYNDYLRESETLMQDFLNSLQGMRDELTQSFSTWADNISSSIRSAFQNGENAARNFRDVTMTMIGDIVEQMIKMAIIEPLMKQALDELMGGSVEQIMAKHTTVDENGEKHVDYKAYSEEMQAYLTDEKRMRNFSDNVSHIGDSAINLVEALGPFLKEAYGWNNQTSQLSGGIQGITEDTARTLEGLSNSILAQNVQQTGYLQDLSQSAFATVQMSWFDGMLNLQQKIEQNTAGLNKAISDMRLNVQPMYVKIA